MYTTLFITRALTSGALAFAPAAAPEPHTDPAPVLGQASLAWSDVDGDGLVDLLAIQGGQLSLHRNLGGGELRDSTAAFGLGTVGDLRDAIWADYDGDGLPDLFVLERGGRARLLRNEAGVEFQDVTLTAGLSSPAAVERAEWGDLDGDGLLDLVAWSSAGVGVYRNRADGTFERLRVELPAVRTGSVASTGDPDGPVAPGVEGLAGAGSAGSGRVPVTPAGSGGASLGLSTGGGTQLAGVVPGGTQTPMRLPPASLWGAQFPMACAKFLLDQATQVCIEASSTPELGKLYPLSASLNVRDSNGYVGVGTTAPLTRLDVVAGTETGLRVVGDSTSALLHTTSTSVPALSVRASGNRAAGFDGRIDIGAYQTFPLFDFLPRVQLDVDGSGAGVMELRASNNSPTIKLQGEEVNGDGGQIAIYNYAGTPTIYLDGDTGVSGGQIALQNSAGIETIEIDAEEVAGNGAQIVLRKANGQASIVLDAEQGGDGRIITEVLEITGGADLVESFDTGSVVCEPGSVLAIDPERPGELMLASVPYDSRVAGIVSGAGDVRPGLHMGQLGVASGSTPVALTGRVYVRCSDENGPVRPGDLLTSSSTAGVAMRATDAERAFGAVIGKAMTSLEGAHGLVLVLVSLQ